jgi:glycosyltransferase involved in cell wall biosynthesis
MDLLINIMSEVTVIIPTAAAYCRFASLKKAIDSIFLATSQDVSIIVAVNGNKQSPVVIAMLESFDRVRIEYFEFSSAPLACREGVRLVSSPYYCFLDDDDEYLPNAIDDRLKKISSNDNFDLVVTNGYRNVAGMDSIYLTEIESITSDPMRALFHQNWLPSCGALFRTDRIGPEYFENPHPYVEWTWLAFNLIISGKNIAVLNEPTYRINETSVSVSKSVEYFNSIYGLYKRMLQCSPQPQTVRLIKSRLADWFHSDAEQKWQQGQMFAAWRSHFQSLTFIGGWRYLTFTRKLFKYQKP